MAILIVDDSPDQHLLLRSLLTQAGHGEILAAESAKAAFEMLNLEGSDLSAPIDLILMDVLMPELDGVSACRQVKSTVHLRDIPIIMVTALNESGDIEKAVNAGADDFLTKPVSSGLLISRLNTLTRRSTTRESGIFIPAPPISI